MLLSCAGNPTTTRGYLGDLVRGLRANALAAVVMLLIQYCLGISVNLYSTLPAGDSGKSISAGFTAAVGNGPLLLSLHALLGTLLLITALGALVRSWRLAATPAIALTAVALLDIIVAWLAGSEFVGHVKNGTSLTIALATAMAILCYTLVIFLLGISPRSSRAEASSRKVRGSSAPRAPVPGDAAGSGETVR
jgi:hypothetical protein